MGEGKMSDGGEMKHGGGGRTQPKMNMERGMKKIQI